MIIVSQDKRIITESLELSVEDIEGKEKKRIMVQEYCGKLYLLGVYETEERAKEVLIEIAQCYCNTKQYEYVSNMPDYSREKVDHLNELAEKAIVYKMPKE